MPSFAAASAVLTCIGLKTAMARKTKVAMPIVSVDRFGRRNEVRASKCAENILQI